MVNQPRGQFGVTLIELLIVIALLSVVFLGAASIYTSALRFLKSRQAVDVTLSPAIALEQITRRTSVANLASLTQAGTQLNLRLDFDVCTTTRAFATPANYADDNYWHYRFVGTQLLSFCDNAAATPIVALDNPGGTVSVIDNLDTATSTVQITNPSSSGAATVISFHVVSTNPLVTIDTESSLGAAPKR